MPKEKNMTQGSVAKTLITFFIPMFIGNLFQQLYGVADSFFIGRYVGTNAFAAVGASLLIINFLTATLIGLSIGASALFSMIYGAGEFERLKRTITTAFIFIIGFSLVLTILSIVFVNPILKVFRMPEVLISSAKQYVIYVFAGLVFVGIYNATSNLLRSLGDSKSPVIILAIACIINIVLDAVFIMIFNMGVAGAAIATLISQIFSGIAGSLICIKKLDFLKFRYSDLIFDRVLFKDVLKYSVLTAVQQSVMTFGMLLVQGIINTFGPSVMAAFSACTKIEELANRPLSDLSNAASTFTAQNIGGKQIKRVKKGVKVAIVMIVVFSIISSTVIFLFSPTLLSIFLTKGAKEEIEIGIRYMKILGPSFFFLGILLLSYGYFRAVGQVKISILMTFASLGTRVILSFVLVKTSLSYMGVPWAVIIGWILSDILGVTFYFKSMKSLESQMAENIKL